MNIRYKLRPAAFAGVVTVVTIATISGLMALGGIIFASCNVDQDEGGRVTVETSGGAIKVEYPAGSASATVRITGSSGKDVFLVKTNASNAVQNASVRAVSRHDYTETAADAAKIAELAALTDEALAKSAVAGRVDREKARNWEPPAVRPAALRKAQLLADEQRLAEVRTAQAATSFEIGVKRVFYDDYSKPVSSVLRWQGEHCNIWVSDDTFDSRSTSDRDNDDAYDNKITLADAEALAEWFDKIYGIETALLGFEYGGDPDHQTDMWQEPGGTDGDMRIQILMYDIDGDGPNMPVGGVYGFFWARDEFSVDDWAYSNECEMFYMDSYFLDKNPKGMYSTLAHEFCHMINFNQKYVINEIDTSNAVWYEEMLAMLTEDLLCPVIEIPVTDSEHPAPARCNFFLNFYDILSLTYFPTSMSGADAYISYARSYFFGAYLVRNYGGMPLLREIVRNKYQNSESVSEALKTVSGDPSLDMGTALSHYGEALVYARKKGTIPEGMNTFDKEVSDTLVLADGTVQPLTFEAIDLWNLDAGDQGIVGHGVQNSTVYYYDNGPHYHSIGATLSIPALSLSVHRASVTSNDFSLNLPKPPSGVTYTVLVR